MDDSMPALRKRRHVFRWIFLAIQAVFVVLVITGNASASGQATESGRVGVSVGVLVIVFLWLAVTVVLGVTWLVLRATRRR
jgi:hypothetical protein